MAIEEKEKKGAVDGSIGQRAISFAQLWSKPFRDLPRYELDFSWPSITTLGLTYELIKREGAGSLPQDFLDGVAAYLGVIGASIWQVFPDDNGRVRLYESDNAVILSKEAISEGGEKPKVVLGRINISKALSRLSTDPQFNFPDSIVDGLTPFTAIRRLALEIFSASSPYLEGSWIEQAAEAQVSRFVSFDLSIAQTTAAYFHRVFPGEQGLNRPEIYLAGPLCPPVGHNEPGPFARSAMALYRNLSSAFPDDTERRQALATISTNLDPQLAAAALLVGIAEGGSSDTQKLRFERIAFYLAPISKQLKGTLELLRKTMVKPGILDLYSKPVTEESKKEINAILDTERALGFLPNLPLGAEAVLTIPKLLPALYMERYDVIENILNEHETETSQNEWLSLLLARSKLAMNDYVGAKGLVKPIQERHGSLIAQESLYAARFFNLVGDILLTDGDFELAAGYFHDALEKCPLGEEKTLSDLVTSQGVALTQLGEVAEGQKCFEEALNINPSNRLARLLIEQPNPTKEELATALRLLPYSLELLRTQIGTALSD